MTASDMRAESSASSRARAAVILAAGKGTRMRSARAKVLHEIGGMPMLGHVLRVADALGCRQRVVVIGHQSEAVAEYAQSQDARIQIARQDPPRGTADAAMKARAALEGFQGDVFILCGDAPLMRAATLARLGAARDDGAAIAALGFETDAPTGYGRCVRDERGDLERIVEEKDASPVERAITLCNSGMLCVDGARLFGWLDRVTSNNAQGEYYLTDLVALARADGERCAVISCPADEALGVNSRAQLAELEAIFQNRMRAAAMRDGATLRAPETVFFCHDTRIGADVEIEPNVVFGPGVEIADDARIRAFSHLEGCRVGPGAEIGPYARLRPGAEIGAQARVGNFVEVKNARLGEGAKANHLTYLGDAEIGAGANIGAGTITCNYDGVSKHRTEIGAGAFIGSNSALVAPVTIGAGAIVAAGSAITQPVEANSLAVARGRQEQRPGRARILRATMQQAKAARDKS